MQQFALIILAQFLVLSYSSSQSELLLNEKQTKTIRLNANQEFELGLEKGDFALIDVYQEGIDLVIETYDPSGLLLDKFDSQNGSKGHEMVLIDAGQSGNFKIKMVTLGERKRERSGSYQIEWKSKTSDIRSHLDASFGLVGDRNYLPGFFLTILDEDEVLYSMAQGYADIEKQTPYTINTIQQIESISKTFISLSLMLLVEAEKLDLDEDINEYLPFEVKNPHFSDKTITLRHLATHTASINERRQKDLPYWIENKEVFLQNRDKYIHKSMRKQYESILNNVEISMEDNLRSFFIPGEKNYSKKNFLKKEPGKEWLYSNIGATLAAYIIELVSDQPYDEFVVENILIPLELENTTWGFNPEMSSANALKYDGGKTEYPRIRGPLYPDGGIYSSTADLTRYLMQWMKGYSGTSKFLRESSYEEIMNVHYEETNGQYKGIKNGLFWWIFERDRMGHNGGSMGSNANIFFYPEMGVGYTSLENLEFGESEGAMIQSAHIKLLLNRYVQYFAIN